MFPEQLEHKYLQQPQGLLAQNKQQCALVLNFLTFRWWTVECCPLLSSPAEYRAMPFGFISIIASSPQRTSKKVVPATDNWLGSSSHSSSQRLNGSMLVVHSWNISWEMYLMLLIIPSHSHIFNSFYWFFPFNNYNQVSMELKKQKQN